MKGRDRIFEVGSKQSLPLRKGEKWEIEFLKSRTLDIKTSNIQSQKHHTPHIKKSKQIWQKAELESDLKVTITAY